jgi:hypothetical protein
MAQPPNPLTQLQIVCGAMLAGPVMFFGAGLLLRFLGTRPADVPIVTYVACAAALVSPLVAGFVRSRLTAGFAGEAVDPQKARRAVIAPIALLEGAALLCATAFLLTPTYWPLLAALVPFATMLAWFPRR